MTVVSFLRVLGASGLLSAVACSLIVQSNKVQCAADGDCLKFDAGGATLACVNNVCVGPGGACNTNTDCLSRSGGQPVTCRKDTKQCATLLSATCSNVYGDYKSDDAIILGFILSLKGSSMSSGVDEVQSAQLALDDFANTVVGLPAAADGKPRPIALVECDDDSGDDQNNATLLASGQHLVNDVGVPAILGPDWSGGCTALINNVTIPAKVLVISPAATSATLTGIRSTSGGRRRRTTSRPFRCGFRSGRLRRPRASHPSSSPSFTRTTRTGLASTTPSRAPSRSTARPSAARPTRGTSSRSSTTPTGRTSLRGSRRFSCFNRT